MLRRAARTRAAPRCASARPHAMNILLTPASIGPVEIPNRIVMPPMTTRGRTTKATSPTRQRRLLHGARARRRGPHHRRDGVAGKGRAPSPPRARHLQRRVPARPHPAGERNPSRRREGLDPARPRRRPHPHRHLRRDADRAVGDPASGLRDDLRDHRAGGDDARRASPQTTAAYAAAAVRARRPVSTASRSTPRTAT